MTASSCSAVAAAAKVILLDIEGTVCPISFVKDILFPYALQALSETLNAKWDSPEFSQYRNAFPEHCAASKTAFEEHVRNLVNRDVKVSYLKSLQGYLWEEGYKSGELKSPLFPDVAPRLLSWHEDGRKIMIYSSGSVPAQKLLFMHTDAQPSDLTPFLTDYFDTVNAGLKTEVGSYERIFSQHAKYPPSEWLFLSDNTKEVDAALQAGMQSFVIYRPGNQELPEEVKQSYKVVESFADL